MQITGLRIRKLADKSEGERVPGYHPRTGEKTLIDPKTDEVSPWPLLGIMFEGDPPKHTRVSTSYIANAVAEGWVELQGEEVVHKPGGPANNPWAVTHTFVQADKIIFKAVEGDVTYEVTHQPDKYDDPQLDEETGSPGGRVDWFYDMKLVDHG